MVNQDVANRMKFSLVTLTASMTGTINLGHEAAMRAAKETGTDYEVWRRPDRISERRRAVRKLKIRETIKEMQAELEQMEAEDKGRGAA